MPEHFISRADAESDLLSCAAFLAERITSIDGHAEAMMAVVPLYLRKENVDLAAELANTIDDPYTRDRLLILVAEKCAEMSDDDYALQLADAVEDHGLRSQALELVALRQAARGDFDAAHEISEKMHHSDSVLVGIAANQAAKGLDTAANETIGEIGFPGAAVTAFHEMAADSLQQGQADKAVAYLEASLGKAQDIEQGEEKSRAFCDIGSVFIEAGRNDKAIEAFDKAKSTAESIDGMHRDAFLSLAAQGFMQAGSLELADRTLDLVTDKTQLAAALLGYSREFWRKDERDEAIESLEEALAILESQHERETRDSKNRFRLFTQIAAQFAGFEKGERAIEIAETINDEGERVAALSQIAAILTIRKEDEQARHAFRAVTGDGDRVFALIGMSDAKVRNDELDSAIDLLKEAAALTETVPQLTFRASGYNEIGRRLLALGEGSQAKDNFRNSLDTITQIRDGSSQVISVAALAQITAETEFSLDESYRPVMQTLAGRAGL
ncbi:MAG: tetratricopeptide repeat protein [Pyrinomonadaceae bacterium]